MLFSLPRHRFEIGGGGGGPSPAPAPAPTPAPAPAPTGNPQAAAAAQAMLQSGPPPLNVTPTYLSSMLPGGVIPQAGLQTANTAQAATVPGYQAATTNVDLSGGDFAKSILNMLQPQFDAQTGATERSLADAGIVGGPTSSAINQLQQGQQTTFQGDLQPALLQLLGLNLNQAQTNAAGTNAASQFDIGSLIGQNQYNTTAQNAMNQFNTTQANANSQYNTGTLLNAAQFQAEQGTNATDALAQFQNQDWLAQLQGQENLAMNGAQAQTQAFTPFYQQPAPVNFGNLAAGLAPAPTINFPNSNDAGGFANAAGQADMANASGGSFAE